MVLADDVLCDRQAQTAAVWASADHWVKYAFKITGIDSRSVVDHVYAHHLAVAFFTDSELTRYACLQSDLCSRRIC